MACKINFKTQSGISIPALGVGSLLREGDLSIVNAEVEAAIENALAAGYRHIDTAQMYQNEKAIGRVLKKWIESGKVKREELFITTKLPGTALRASDVENSLKESLENLQLSYLDLYLIHGPLGFYKNSDKLFDWTLDKTTDLVAVWKEMEKQVDNGKTRAIGVSNFNNEQIERLLKNGRIPPATNQVEFHLYLQQPKLVEFHKKNNVSITAYASLGSPGLQAAHRKLGMDDEKDAPSLLENPTVVEIAKKHNKTPAQVLLRHIVQNGHIAIPKSGNPKRLKENMDIFDFELSADEMKKLDGEDRHLRFFKWDKPRDLEHPEHPWREEVVRPLLQ